MTDAAISPAPERPARQRAPERAQRASERGLATSARRRSLAEQSSELRVAIMRVSRRLRQERTATELSASQFSTLAWISVDGPLTIGHLAEREQVTAPSMNRTVNCLVDAGYVTRSSAPDDGRKVLVATTDAGEAVVRETRRRRDAWLAKRFAALTPTERETLAEATTILRRLLDE